MIKAVIFDMDGLLINSEPLWRKTLMLIFNNIGVPITPENAGDSMGLRPDEAIDYWYHRFPWKTPSLQVMHNRLVTTMIEVLTDSEIAQPGVYEIIKQCKAANLPMAIASSSPLAVINAGIKNLGIEHDLVVIYSAEDDEYGKPHPAVYLRTARALNIKPEYCLVFEDSPAGVLAAKSAKMICVAVPDATIKDSPKIQIADMVLNSLTDFTPILLKKLSVL